MIKPTRGKILGEIKGRGSMSAGGIYLPDAKKTAKPEKCDVIAIGGEFFNQKGDRQTYRCAVGEIAHFKLAEGNKWRKDGRDYIFLENQDIIAIESEHNLLARGEFVVIEPVFEKEHGKIILADSSVKRIGDFYGNVLSVGDECNLGIVPGAKVRYTRDEGYPREVGGRKLLVINQKWIIAEEE